jgi:glutamate carboxypeptidase
LISLPNTTLLGNAMTKYETYLKYIDDTSDETLELLIRWANINSGSQNLTGLNVLAEDVRSEFLRLGAEPEFIELSRHSMVNDDGAAIEALIGRALHMVKRPAASKRVLLSCHMDTVYGPDHPFQKCSRLSEDVLGGPGACDAKGGIVVMLKALEALERSPFAEDLGWEVIINPDEEIGSPGSRALLEKAAVGKSFGLVFEPSLSDGNLVSRRKGSGNFAAVAHGKAAHAGRDPKAGRNAVNALADLIMRINRINNDEITLNVGFIHGGGPVNIVPDRAICRFNVRTVRPEHENRVMDHVNAAFREVSADHGVSFEIHGGFTRPPKLLDDKTLTLLRQYQACGEALGLTLNWAPSGGSCDGNNLSRAGLTTIDSLGVTGGNIHSADEFVRIPSLAERAKLSALFLMRYAEGEFEY